jgi:uncharacterized protein
MPAFNFDVATQLVPVRTRFMMRRLILALVIACVGFGAFGIVVENVSVDAAAQARNSKPNFIQRLLGIRPEPPPVVRKLRRPSKKATKRSSRSGSRNSPRSARAEPPVETVEVQPKDADARKILVAGDFVAGGLAWGLEQTFADEPKILVVDKSNANSSLVRADNYDWNAELLDVLNEVQPDLIVVAFGANDRQQLRDGETRHPLRSDVWVATYTQRVTGIADTLKVYGRPFFWVSAPPMRNTEASSDMAYLNTLYEPSVKAAGGHFVDIWNGFTNQDGHYVASGPDVEGQVRQLRNRDGINFTRAGRLKLAFYVNREIRRQTGFGSGSVDLLATVTLGNQIEIGPDGEKILVGPIVSLNDPLPGSNGELAGAVPAKEPATDSLQFKVIVRGEEMPDVPGRADDFVWPPRRKTGLLPKPAAPEPVAEATVPVPVARPGSVAN